MANVRFYPGSWIPLKKLSSSDKTWRCAMFRAATQKPLIFFMTKKSKYLCYFMFLFFFMIFL